ncbi:MAG: DUF6090 family protein [Pseudomonadota bacterium]
MILRRITEHVRAQNWFAVVIDFCIVVIGVFIGIQVANWNEARVNRNIETTYLELLQRDLQTTQQELDAQIAFEQFQMRLVNEAAPIIEEPSSEIRKQKLGIILTRLGGRRTLRVDGPTFLDLQSSGRLGLISDPELRSAIVSYFFRVQRQEPVIDKNNTYYVDERYNDFLENSSIGYWLWDDDLMGPPILGGLGSVLADHGEYIHAGLTDAGGASFMLPPDDIFWHDVKARLARRSGIAFINRSVAIGLLDETAVLEEKISAYLERSR